jgi:hypothetical protein
MSSPRSPTRQAADVQAALDRLSALVNAHRSQLAGLAGEALADWVYAHWYMAPAVPFARRDLQAPPQGVSRLLRAALESPQYWEPGWVALEVAPGQRVLAGKGAQRRVLEAGDYANMARPGAPVVPGDGLATFSLLAWVDAPTGFQGVRHYRAEPSGPLVRLYFSVGLGSLARVLRDLIEVLEALDTAWSLKCPVQPAGYGRIDTLVVYLPRAQWPRAEASIVDAARCLAGHLRDAVPPLARVLGRGVAFAEDPPGLESFGQSRCVALAKGIEGWLARQGPAEPLRRRTLLMALQRAGIDTRRPWCHPATESEFAAAPA